MESKQNEKENKLDKEALDDYIKDLMEKWQAGKIDDFDIAVAALYTLFVKRLLPHLKEDNAYIGILMGCMRAGNITPKQNQRIKEELRKLEREVSALEASSNEKNDRIDEVLERIDKLLVCMLGIYTEGNDK